MAFLFALILIIALIWFSAIWITRENPGFDERQIHIQRKAYQIGFIIESVYMLGLFIYGVMAGDPPVSWTLLIMVGIWLAMIPVVTITIWKDAYFKPGQKLLGFGICEILVGLMNLYTLHSLYQTAPVGETDRLLPMVFADTFCFWVGTLTIVKHFVNQRTEKAE